MTDAPSATRSRYWILPVARAVVALVAAAIVTFTSLHSAAFGLYVFGAFAVVTGIVTAVLGRLTLNDPVTRLFFLTAGVVGALGGVLALALPGGDLPLLLAVVAIWGVVTGVSELYCGIRTRPRTSTSRDWMLVGGFTVVLAIVFLLIPGDPVLAVGLFGAYAVIIGVYLAIAGLSEKWRPQNTESGGAEPNGSGPAGEAS